VVNGAEMVAVFARDNGQLVVRVSRFWVQFGGKTIVSLGRAPVALLVLLDELGFTVAGKVAEVNQGLVAGVEDLVVEEGRDALARGCLGGWYGVSVRLEREATALPSSFHFWAILRSSGMPSN
jgi:hypothetical protein